MNIDIYNSQIIFYCHGKVSYPISSFLMTYQLTLGLKHTIVITKQILKKKKKIYMLFLN